MWLKQYNTGSVKLFEDHMRALLTVAGVVVVPERDRSAGAVRSALRTVMRDQRYRTAARRAADSMAALPPHCTGAVMVERLASERQPVLGARVRGAELA